MRTHCDWRDIGLSGASEGGELRTYSIDGVCLSSEGLYLVPEPVTGLLVPDSAAEAGEATRDSGGSVGVGPLGRVMEVVPDEVLRSIDSVWNSW
jgi:hypothetical protein